MRRGITAALLVVAFAAAGCGGGDNPVGDRTPPTGGPPSPAGAAEVSDLPDVTEDTSCGDPTASLRPTGPPPAPGDFPANTYMAEIRTKGKLVVGVDQNTYKFGFRNPETGDPEGFDVDMAREIARAIFGDPDRIQYRVLTSDQRIDAVSDGKVDLVVQTMTVNCDRRKEVDFSSVYYQAGQKVLVKKGSGYEGIDDLGGRKVCAAAGSTSIQRIVNAPSKPIGVAVPGWTDCLVMLQQNQVEAVSTDDTILAGLADQDQRTEIVGEPMSEEPYAMAIAKGRPEFVRFVNAVIANLVTSGRWLEIYNYWLSELLTDEPVLPTPNYVG